MDHVAASGESIFSSALLHLEMTRVLRREGIDLSRGKLVTDRVTQVSIEDGVLRTAAAIELHVKTLDAIHLATASLLGYDVTVATHDAGMRRAAEDLGFDTIDPIDTTT